MLEELKNWIFSIARDFIDGTTAGAGELCNETVETAGTICDETRETAGTICDGTRKANAEFVKAFMDGI